jgi:hypothetical protein
MAKRRGKRCWSGINQDSGIEDMFDDDAFLLSGDEGDFDPGPEPTFPPAASCSKKSAHSSANDSLRPEGLSSWKSVLSAVVLGVR